VPGPKVTGCVTFGRTSAEYETPDNAVGKDALPQMALGIRSARKSDSGPGHQLNNSTTAFHFDAGSIARIHTDDHTLPADPQVQVRAAVVD
jgi:hypothetical protein